MRWSISIYIIREKSFRVLKNCGGNKRLKFWDKLSLMAGMNVGLEWMYEGEKIGGCRLKITFKS